MLANADRSKLYLGRTQVVHQRMEQHVCGRGGAFSRMHQTHTLVYLVAFDTPDEAAAWEWKLKKWKRAWKNALIEESNPEWKDLMDQLPIL